ncbi:peptidase, M50 family [Candidatus Magnetoovum chiemensis]|nr:peptidase, M50 family [Candidatus Magnetoovum chiemensis]
MPIIIAITFHEVAHGWAAYKLGDPTAKNENRLTLNPIAHIDPLWTILIPLIVFVSSQGHFIFGSAKPVPVNFHNLRNPKKDMALVAAAGPITNILIAMASLLVFTILQRLLFNSTMNVFFLNKIIYPVAQMLDYSVLFNIFIAAFNLIPIPPLDGGRIAVSLLPNKIAYEYSKIEPFGIIIVLVLLMSGLGKYVIAPIEAVIRLIISIFYAAIGSVL